MKDERIGIGTTKPRLIVCVPSFALVYYSVKMGTEPTMHSLPNTPLNENVPVTCFLPYSHHRKSLFGLGFLSLGRDQRPTSSQANSLSRGVVFTVSRLQLVFIKNSSAGWPTPAKQFGLLDNSSQEGNCIS